MSSIHTGLWVCLLMWSIPLQAGSAFQEQLFPLVAEHCLDCHDGETQKGALDLERFEDEHDSLSNRRLWKQVYDLVEAGMMPPPKRRSKMPVADREQFLAALDVFLALPDPELGAVDPGKPVLRRLNRLEYNNSVRDLLGLDLDLFMFSERLPISKDYFRLEKGQLPDRLEMNVREYGQRYPVLLPQSGLPVDNRAAHGFNNRGDVMNVSPLQLEKYVALAGEIVNEPTLPFRSEVFADLIGVDPATLPKPKAMQTSVGIKASEAVGAVAVFAGNDNIMKVAAGSSAMLSEFRETLADAIRKGVGGVFDVPAGFNNQTIPGKGGLIRVNFGGKQFVMNPNEDLWLAAFGTAIESSGGHLIANKNKGEKAYGIELSVRQGDRDEGIIALGVCVLSRRGETGEVTLTATYSNDSEQKLHSSLVAGEGADNTLFTFRAPEGETIKLLTVNGADFSGDYVLLDDIGFVSNGLPRSPVIAAEKTPVHVAVERAMPVKEFAPPRERLSRFLERAFRMPVSETDVDPYWSLFESMRQEGRSEALSMKATLQAVLASPRFLFVEEANVAGAGSVRALNDYELASRLSYFLWSTVPDEPLLALAREGKLRNPATLAQQTRRMLRDPRVRELSESFAVQWLRLDQLYTAKPDPVLFKAFYRDIQGKDTLHASLLVEALLLFETVLIEDRSVLDFIAADYTWLNSRLAELYDLSESVSAMLATEDAVILQDSDGNAIREIPKVGKKDWFRVSLSDPLRGGYLTMGAPLTVTSLPFRTSPVKRGAWFLETILNRPPPEPKVAFVLKEAEEEHAGPATVREMFERHRNDPACYTCHTRLDPPGFALEAFSPIGAWRERDGEAPVDAHGEWQGVSFDGPRGFKQALRENPRPFVRGFVEHLMAYALGRSIEYFDQATLNQIMESQGSEGYRLSGLISEIVQSRAFRFVRNDQNYER